MCNKLCKVINHHCQYHFQILQFSSHEALPLLFLYLNQVCEKELYCMDWAVKMMQKVCKVFSTAMERNNFLQNVANAFACVIMEMLQSVMAGE